MNQTDPITAAMLRNGASGLAGFAAGDLLESYPHLKQSLATQAFANWQGVLRSCVEELGAALSAGRPQLFTGHVGWLQSLLTARGLPPNAVPCAVGCLAKVLAAELPAALGTRAASVCQDALRALDGPVPELPSFVQADTPHGRLAASYLLALLEGDRARASRLIMDAAAAGSTVPELCLQVLLPAQQEVGRMWQTDEINVAEEHFATSTTKMILAQLRLRAPIRQPNGKTLLTASVMGNQHDIGLQVVADFFEMDGWKVIHLGSDMPIPDLVQAVESYQPDLLALSVSLHAQLVALADTIQAVRRGEHGAAVKILVGGQAFAESPDLAPSLGADGHAADPLAAVAQGNLLAGVPA
jgi:MerR family transcriptional regulator, light-induced transcriptional regulator